MRLPPMWKALVLRAIGLFLFYQWMRGKLPLYINQRFVFLVVLASFGVFFMGAAYHTCRVPGEHKHHHHHHGHFSWGGLFLVLFTIISGLMAPQKPLGSDALRHRVVSAKEIGTVVIASDNQRVLLTPVHKRTLLDWVLLSSSAEGPEVVVGEQATVSGFVFHEKDAANDRFLLSRFVITCCAADAVPIGLQVYWPSSDTLVEDQWVEVSGHFELKTHKGQQTPVLIADIVTLQEVPDQPYLYP